MIACRYLLVPFCFSLTFYPATPADAGSNTFERYYQLKQSASDDCLITTKCKPRDPFRDFVPPMWGYFKSGNPGRPVIRYWYPTAPGCGGDEIVTATPSSDPAPQCRSVPAMNPEPDYHQTFVEASRHCNEKATCLGVGFRNSVYGRNYIFSSSSFVVLGAVALQNPKIHWWPEPACAPGETYGPPASGNGPGVCVLAPPPPPPPDPGPPPENIDPVREEKNLGEPDCGVGNPCNPATGNKYQQEVDYRSANGLVTFIRHYNSDSANEDVGLGRGWTSNFHRRADVNGARVVVHQADGRRESFTCNINRSGRCTGDADTRLVLEQDVYDYPDLGPVLQGHNLILPDGSLERYNHLGLMIAVADKQRKTQTIYGSVTNNGLVERVADFFRHTLRAIWGAGHLRSIIDPAGGVYEYAYDSNDNLVQVIYPDRTARIYHYEDSRFPNHLTGITDENGDRFATFAYDAAGRAILTEHAGGQERVTLTYDSATQTTVTDALGTQEVLTFQDTLGARNLLSRINQVDGKGITQAFDANGNLIRRTDEESRTTTFAYNANNQLMSVKKAAGTPEEHTTTFEYLSDDIDLPTRVTTPSIAPGQSKRIIIVYDDYKNPIIITQAGRAPFVERTIRMQYHPFGKVEQIDGPRGDIGDITRFEYYECRTGVECGHLKQITNALGHTTTFDTYDPHGRVTQITDPNGVVTTFTYDLRGRLLTHTQTPPTGPVRITTNSYDLIGQLISTTTPDGTTLTYTYDAAHNLRSISDNLGNRIEYGYDLKGNRTAERTIDPDNTLVRTVETSYDIRSRVASINAGGSMTQLVYDAVGNLVGQTDPNDNPPFSHSYDALNRLLKSIDTLSGQTTYGYDVHDQITQLTAPNGATTKYVYDDLGNLLQEISPDRGTITYTYDAYGHNVKTLTDARDITAHYTYDALNRVTLIDYPGTTEDVTFTYDACINGIGRLCTTDDESGTTTLAYDVFGNVTQQDKTELGQTYITQYTYDLGDRVTSMTYPDGRVATYTRDALGHITDVSMTVNGAATNLVNSLTYRADGLLAGQTFSNGINETRDYDLQGRLETQTIGTTDTRIYTYDANGNVTAFTGNAASASYGYDELDRLTQDTSSLGTSSFTYDANGNRLSSAGPWIYSYVPQSNRLQKWGSLNVVLDEAGNFRRTFHACLVCRPMPDAPYTLFNYNNAGRLSEIRREGWNPTTLSAYTYNAQGLRSRKVTPLFRKVPAHETTVYHYDLNGNIIAETREDGSLRRAYVWADDRPLVQIDVTGAAEATTYLHTDHLNTPRLATNTQGKVVWRWDGQAFGVTAPDEDPDANGLRVIVNLRFPGQYYDAESGLHYNWHRYYNPTLGRYITSDPVGLFAGLNTYGYVSQNPLVKTDPTGEILPILALAGAGALVGGSVNTFLTIVANRGQVTLRQGIAAFVSGAVSGAAGALAGPVAGTLARSGVGTVQAILATGISGAGGAIGQSAANFVAPCHRSSPLKAAAFAAGGFGLVRAAFPTTKVANTLRQINDFGPKFTTLLREPLFNSSKPEAALLSSAIIVSTSVGTAANF